VLSTASEVRLLAVDERLGTREVRVFTAVQRRLTSPAPAHERMLCYRGSKL
jgi:hypothetical protein